jgi:CRISPR-associated protein Cmr1
MSTKIETIRVTYDLATPLFCGGADPTMPEVRLSSFKGVLRWYWRAVVWEHIGGALETIQKAEQTLFGSPGLGQGKVCMRWARGAAVPSTLAKDDVLKDERGRTVGAGARYLGYGVMEAFGSQVKKTVEGQLSRGCVVPPLALAIELRCRDLTTEERATLLLALRAVGLLGAMGGKSRKGYGSLVLRDLTVDGSARWQAPRTMEELHACIVELRRDCAGTGRRDDDDPPYTALTSRARHVLIAARDQVHPAGLLDLVGRELVRYRSWGRDGRVLQNATSERRFQLDHDLMKDVKAGRDAQVHPQRVAFGLPHNYGRDRREQVGPRATRNRPPLDRRASPLLIHIHRCSETPVAVLSFLPAQFLPDGATVSVGGTPVPVAATPGLWEPIEDLLDRFMGRPSPAGPRQEPFGKALEVRA